MSDTASTPSIDNRVPVIRHVATAWPMIAAAVLGAGLLYVVGFAGPQSIHDAAHDARHTLNFPCH